MLNISLIQCGVWEQGRAGLVRDIGTSSVLSLGGETETTTGTMAGEFVRALRAVIVAARVVSVTSLAAVITLLTLDESAGVTVKVTV